MKQLLLILTFVCSTSLLNAKKFFYPFEVVAGSADLIVLGEIETVFSGSYTFKVDETLKGLIHETIRVQKFREWTCDVRFAKHESGQKLCLFLKKGTGSWEIINGSTGERPILENGFFRVIDDFKDLKPGDFKEGIKEFCKCYEYIGEYGIFNDNPPTFKRLCSEDLTLSFKNMNHFTKWLYDEVNEYKIVTDK